MSNRLMKDVLIENEILRSKLNEATETLDAIRSGQVDALVVSDRNGHALYTLQTADHAYRVFIEQMAEGAVSLTSEGLVIYSNSQFSKIINKPLSTIIGRHFSEFVSPEHRSQFEELFRHAWDKNIKAEIEMVSDSGPIHVQVSLSTIQFEGEYALSLIVSDLTRQKEIEQQLISKNNELERLNRALISSNNDLQQFASVASHDLQEPLRKIQVFSKLLQERSQDQLSESLRQYIEKIVFCSQRMKVLIIDILTYSRLSTGETTVERVELNTIVREILEDFDLNIAEKNAKITLDQLCAVEGNAGQLRQVFFNLISNALKFVSGDRVPHLSITQQAVSNAELGINLVNESNYCRIVVSDNGIGFDGKFSFSIFSLFERLNPKTTFEGSGIGLAISKKIVDKHHGMIVAKSTPGQGSEFNVILPFKQPVST